MSQFDPCLPHTLCPKAQVTYYGRLWREHTERAGASQFEATTDMYRQAAAACLRAAILWRKLRNHVAREIRG